MFYLCVVKRMKMGFYRWIMNKKKNKQDEKGTIDNGCVGRVFDGAGTIVGDLSAGCPAELSAH